MLNTLNWGLLLVLVFSKTCLKLFLHCCYYFLLFSLLSHSCYMIWFPYFPIFLTRLSFFVIQKMSNSSLVMLHPSTLSKCINRVVRECSILSAVLFGIFYNMQCNCLFGHVLEPYFLILEKLQISLKLSLVLLAIILIFLEKYHRLLFCIFLFYFTNLFL